MPVGKLLRKWFFQIGTNVAMKIRLAPAKSRGHATHRDQNKTRPARHAALTHGHYGADVPLAFIAAAKLGIETASSGGSMQA